MYLYLEGVTLSKGFLIMTNFLGLINSFLLIILIYGYDYYKVLQLDFLTM